MSTDKPIIEIRGLGKRYNITHQKGGYVTLRDVLANIVRKPLSFLKHKVKKAVGFQTKEAFWALRNITLSIRKGEIIGVIGANGAGKSTLLKILTGITPPTEGEVIMRGKVASLLEVGTGFHPELTGRENIFLNGAILGMTRKEVVHKFDEIVAFAEISKFLDTPVKHYSSGMYVRLAFSVAAHMEPDILLVDEVLAVGDAEFQKKCLGKMEEVTKKNGRTILFVSHNLPMIEKLCSRVAIVHGGSIAFVGEPEAAIRKYTEIVSTELNEQGLDNKPNRKGAQHVTLEKVSFYDAGGKEVRRAVSGDPLVIGLSYRSTTSTPLQKCRVAFSVRNISGQDLFVCSTELTSSELTLPSSGEVRCRIERFPLSKGSYFLNTLIEVNKQREDFVEDAVVLNVEDGDFFGSGVTYPQGWEGRGILVPQSWEAPPSTP